MSESFKSSTLRKKDSSKKLEVGLKLVNKDDSLDSEFDSVDIDVADERDVSMKDKPCS